MKNNTFRTITEKELLNEKKFTEAAINSLQDTFFVFNPKTGKAVRWNKIFEKINAVVSYTTGAGLGLFVAKSFVEAWGGKISFSSKLNKGTTFIVTLPV